VGIVVAHLEERYGTLPMKGLEELSGDAIKSTVSKERKAAKTSILMTRSYIKPLSTRLMP
jgi:hypothetical protein